MNRCRELWRQFYLHTPLTKSDIICHITHQAQGLWLSCRLTRFRVVVDQSWQEVNWYRHGWYFQETSRWDSRWKGWDGHRDRGHLWRRQDSRDLFLSALVSSLPCIYTKVGRILQEASHREKLRNSFREFGQVKRRIRQVLRRNAMVSFAVLRPWSKGESVGHRAWINNFICASTRSFTIRFLNMKQTNVIRLRRWNVSDCCL